MSEANTTEYNKNLANARIADRSWQISTCFSNPSTSAGHFAPNVVAVA